MAAQLMKYMDVDIVSFLEKEMERNTHHYKSDFDIDKRIIEEAVSDPRKEVKTLLWLSRPNGTYCCKEHDAFIKDTAAHNTWRYYAENTNAPIVAYAVEVSGEANGRVRGNLYQLDYPAHAAEVAEKSVAALVYQKTFEDGFMVEVEPERSCFGFFYELVNEHGKITASLAIPRDGFEHSSVLAEQRGARSRLNLAELKKTSLDLQIKDATLRSAVSVGMSKKPLGHEFAR